MSACPDSSVPLTKRPSQRWIERNLTQLPELAGIRFDKNPALPDAAEDPQRKRRRAYVAAINSATAKLTFVIAPLVILAMVLHGQGKLHSILGLPEWMILAVVMDGETIVIASFIGKKVMAEQFMFLLSAFIVLIFTPSMCFLATVLEIPVLTLPNQFEQLAWFIVSAVFFWMVCWLNTYMRKMDGN